jgi:hypothetical protein
MPEIQQYQSQINPEPQQPIQQNPEAYGAAINQAVGNLGNAAQNVGNMVMQRSVEMQQQRDTQQVLDTEIKARSDLNTLQDSLTKRLGENANGVTNEFVQGAAKIKQQYAGTLAGKNQQLQFNQLFDNHYMYNERAVAGHEAQQRLVGQENTMTSHLALNTSDAAKDPSKQHMESLMADGFSTLDGAGKNIFGWDSATVEVKKQEYAGQLISSAVTPLVANKDFSGAKAVIDDYGKYMNKGVKEALLKQVDNGIWENNKDATAVSMYQKYGEDIGGAVKDIRSQKDLDPQRKDELIDAYRSQVGLQNDIENQRKKILLDKGVSQIAKAGSLTNAINIIKNNFPLTDYRSAQEREVLTNIANQQYGTGNIKTDPLAWIHVHDLINAGKIKSDWDLYSQFKNSISFGDMKSFIDALDKTSNNPYNKYSLGSDGLKMLAQNGVTDRQQMANFWDYYSNEAGDFTIKNKRKPTSGELHDMMAKSLAKVKVGEWQARPFGIPLDQIPVVGGLFQGNVMGNQFSIPEGFKWDTKNKAYVGYDENGNKVKYVP